ncbi:MAG: hypothetical protein HY898_29400 [Deltaproteobacteria bacterium]|nr:hypothetical protein [Deltaproteobacteria bacterium]
MNTPADPQLAMLHKLESTGTELPLPLKRFRSEAGAATAIAAMEVAADRVLAACGLQSGHERLRVSASELCRVCDIRLEGAPKRTAKRASRGLSSEKFSGHTGSLSLDPAQPLIRLPAGIDFVRARIAVGHEIGHYLLHRRASGIDRFTARLESTPAEEAIAEYAGRVLLMRHAYADTSYASNVVLECMNAARRADVTLHAAAARVGDPDVKSFGSVAGLILWRINPAAARDAALASRLTPSWHLCGGAFIPVGRCHARRSSLIAEVASSSDGNASASRTEEVEIGSLKGRFRVDAVAWGSSENGTRLVLSAFLEE